MFTLNIGGYKHIKNINKPKGRDKSQDNNSTDLKFHFSNIQIEQTDNQPENRRFKRHSRPNGPDRFYPTRAENAFSFAHTESPPGRLHEKPPSKFQHIFKNEIIIRHIFRVQYNNTRN